MATYVARVLLNAVLVADLKSLVLVVGAAAVLVAVEGAVQPSGLVAEAVKVVGLAVAGGGINLARLGAFCKGKVLGQRRQAEGPK